MTSGARDNVWTLRKGVEELFPGYFAMVMATGIVSLAAFFEGYPLFANVLAFLNIAVYAVLILLLAARAIISPAKIGKDITDHLRGPGFFTLPAGTCVLGSQVLILWGTHEVATSLWLFGLVTWAVVMYTFFAAVTTREEKPTLVQGLSGTWLIAVVATQSISVLGTLLATQYPANSRTLLFFTLSMFMIGCMLYIMLITLIFYRFTFVDLTSERLTPPYWINMGAVAITTLAGARLLLASGSDPLLKDIIPFLKGFTIFFWASGTWWIPLLFILGIWRHVYKRFPLRYDPQYWGLVFPLGMYTVCTFQLSKALEYESLMMIPSVFVYLAIVAWLVALFGFAISWIPPRASA